MQGAFWELAKVRIEVKFLLCRVGKFHSQKVKGSIPGQGPFCVEFA